MSRTVLHPRGADEAASSSDSDSDRVCGVARLPKRSATVSPSTRSIRHHQSRRRSDCNLAGSGVIPSRASAGALRRRPPNGRRSGTRERSTGRTNSSGRTTVSNERPPLRKTYSEPSVEIGGQEFNVNTIRQLLESLPRLSQQRLDSPSSRSSTAELLEDEVYTGIEELRDAAKSIQSLQRVLTKMPPQAQEPASCFSDDASTAADSAGGGSSRVSGISTRLGSHPRGVMQFLPSIRTEQFTSSEDTYRNRRPLSRKTSAPENYLHLDMAPPEHIHYGPPLSPNVPLRGPSQTEPRSPRRRAVCDELYSAGGGSSARADEEGGRGASAPFPSPSSHTLQEGPAASLSRFSQLLKRLGGSPEPAPEGGTDGGGGDNWSQYAYGEREETEEVARTDTPLLEADVLLWKKRSRASLRRHSSVRNMAARELYDTEKSFVEGLEYLVQKYMRPLRQPLEATLIEAGLVDKIFYKIPEILAHHQVLVANLSARIEGWHKDTMIGDVLLAHFSKQSMVETYISFVDNFQYAKSAITQARTKPSFEKYYNRCCRDHRNKLDLDSMLISPIQRVPRYELIVKQLLKHTPVYHPDHERLLRAQKHVHLLATNINRHRQVNEQAEQRLREIEAIVDGLDDLVAAGRSFLRYDMVSVRGREGKKARCVFTFTDQLVLTSVKRRPVGRNGKILVGQSEYLDANRFQLLIKIAFDDVEIAKDTLSVLRETEAAIEELKENIKVLQKMSELANLLRGKREKLVDILSEMETEHAQRLRTLNEQLATNPDLTTVLLSVTTLNGVESVPIEFGCAEKRKVWESAFREAKAAQLTQRVDASAQCQLKCIVAHQSRPGLHLCAATVVPGKRVDSAPFVWACTADRFQGQVAVVSLEGGEPTIESCAGIGNSAVVAVCTVPPPLKPVSRKRRLARVSSTSTMSLKEEFVVDLPSGSASSDSSDEDTASTNIGMTTVWIGNEDGEVFVLNCGERVRTRPRERVARLTLPVDAIATMANCVFVSASREKDVKLLAFRPLTECSWDLEHPNRVPLEVPDPIRTMSPAGRRLAIATGVNILLLNPTSFVVEVSLNVSPSLAASHVSSPPPPCPTTHGLLRTSSSSTAVGPSISQSSSLSSSSPPSPILSSKSSVPHTPPEARLAHMAVAGSVIFAAATKSTVVTIMDLFSLDRLSQFSIGSTIQSLLTGRDDILREHKLGCLRVSALIVADCRLWIGTSAGFVLHTPVAFARSQPQPIFSVCGIGHAGPCRLLLPIPMSPPVRRRGRSSLSVHAQHSVQLVLSCGEGLDEANGTTQDGTSDAINHLLFWKTTS